MWWSRGERRALIGVGVIALIGLAVLLWQQQRPPLTVASVSASGPAVAGASARGLAWDEALSGARRVDVNTAGVAELERLPGIGPMLAHRIVDDRIRHGRFRSPEDLARVPGIGPTRAQALADYVAAE